MISTPGDLVLLMVLGPQLYTHQKGVHIEHLQIFICHFNHISYIYIYMYNMARHGLFKGEPRLEQSTRKKHMYFYRSNRR